MISFVCGTVSYIGESNIIVNNNGMGYNILIHQSNITKVILDSELKIYTHMSVRDDNICLYGFLSMQELYMFEKLITVSGVGPKAAQAVLSCATPEEINLAIATEDIDILSRASGIGKKTAQRIVLELKDKIKLDYFGETSEYNGVVSSEKQDAVDALISLGYSRAAVLKIVSKISDENQTATEIIKFALKALSKE